jgi:NACHT domain- and WD repeat-containing protein
LKALLSHRYGVRQLPTRIVEDEYNIIKNEMANYEDEIDLKFELNLENDEKVIDNLLDYCYELDTNEVPARYRLKYLNKIFKFYSESDAKVGKAWRQMERKLGQAFRFIALKCLEKKLINKTQYDRYFVSVTEKEIYNGILKTKNVNDNALYFVRQIEDYETDTSSVKSKFFENEKSSNDLLYDLMEKKIPVVLSEKNIFKFKVKWVPEVGISLETHSNYVKEFGEMFYEKVKLLIDRNQSKYNLSSLRNYPLIKEVLYHAHFCNDSVKKFQGRDDVLDKIKSYLLNINNQKPFIIYGNSGCGKTAILAKFTSEVTLNKKTSNFSLHFV